jgi:geranylgeranyl diphosphate synthase type II
LQTSYPDHLRTIVERYLESLRFCAEPACAGLEEAMRYSLLAGGKRIRPVLSLATGTAIGTSAILAGDGLYAEAFRLLLTEQRGASADVLAAGRELAAATGLDGMVGGQYVDVAGSAPAGAEGLRRLHELKTGRLIGASIGCVLVIGGIGETDTIECFRTFASELGVLFQIVDDILDVTGSQETLGKPQGSDERLGKRTYVSEFGLDGARRLASESHTRARAALANAAPAGAEDLEQITDFIATRTY